VMDGLDKSLLGKDMLPSVKETLKVVGERSTNWCFVPVPHPAWAALVHPDLPADEAYQQLWRELEHALRLDEPDPLAASDERMAVLSDYAARLTERRFDAIELRGPGTEVTIGLARGSSADRRPHAGADTDTQELMPRRDSFPYQSRATGRCMRNYDIRYDDKYGQLAQIDVAAEGAGYEPWVNQTLTSVNDSVVRLAVIEGELVDWHSHEHEDEFFLVLEGKLELEVEGREPFVLGVHQGVTIPRGVLHHPRAHGRTVLLMVEPATVIPTGND